MEDLRETLAAIEHDRWSSWQEWCHRVIREKVPSSPELETVLRRWDRQIATPYSQLTHIEKNSDREQVDRYWPNVKQFLASELQRLSTREGDTIWYTDTENDVVMTLEERIAELLGDDKQGSLSVVDEADNHEQDGKR